MLSKPNKISGFETALRYPGGKTKIAGSVKGIIDHNFDESQKKVLVEPYAGGAGASLVLLFNDFVDSIIINDLDRSIYSFWKIATSDTDYLVDKILKTEITIDEWRRQKSIYCDPSSVEKELAFATLFLNRTNRSGILDGGPIGGLEQSGVWKIDARFNKTAIVERLRKIQKYKKKIKVRNFDGIKLLKKLEQSKFRDNYFVFLDPPYYQKGKSLYLNHYNNEDHEKLSNFLKTTHLKWVMTYDDNPFIRSLYQEMKKNELEVRHTAFKSRKGKEILIFSDHVMSCN